MAMPRETVYERAHRTGYMMGSNHRMGAAFDGVKPTPAADMGDESADKQQDPPNLRDSIDTSQCCGTCGNFGYDDGSDSGKSMCDKYHVPVTANQVCDDYEEKQPDNAKEMIDGPREPSSEMGA